MVATFLFRIQVQGVLFLRDRMPQFAQVPPSRVKDFFRFTSDATLRKKKSNEFEFKKIGSGTE